MKDKHKYSIKNNNEKDTRHGKKREASLPRCKQQWDCNGKENRTFIPASCSEFPSLHVDYADNTKIKI